jgi:phosphotransferase system HPr (HPr) family protein
MEEQVTVRNYPGIHAHPAVLFVKRASLFKSEVKISNGSLTVNGKSIMGVLMLAAETGVVLTIRATGPDECEAVTALVRLVDSKFEEGA